MIEQDKPTFWEKVVAFVLACLLVAGGVSLVQLGLVGLLRICR